MIGSNDKVQNNCNYEIISQGIKPIHLEKKDSNNFNNEADNQRFVKVSELAKKIDHGNLIK